MGNGCIRPTLNLDKDPQERALVGMVLSLTQPEMRPALQWV
jgi:hypothetical protein